MGTLSVTEISASPNDLAASAVAAASGGDVFANDGRTLLYIINGATAVTVTATAQTTSFEKSGVGTVTKANKTITVGANKEGLFGPFEKAAFDNSSGQVALSYDDETNVRVLPLRIPRAV